MDSQNMPIVVMYIMWNYVPYACKLSMGNIVQFISFMLHNHSGNLCE